MNDDESLAIQMMRHTVTPLWILQFTVDFLHRPIADAAGYVEILFFFICGLFWLSVCNFHGLWFVILLWLLVWIPAILGSLSRIRFLVQVRYLVEDYLK